MFLKREDLVIGTYNSLNSPHSADNGVTLLHIPTGKKVRAGEFRSQHKNRDKAIKMLLQKLEGYLPIDNKILL